jgi:hypothetical protein
MVVVQMGYSRRWVADTLRRIGYQQEADEALRVLPGEVIADGSGNSATGTAFPRDELVSRMGGSP